MDVHHHTHTDRKKLKHYLFEFFMLFLAVFSGFLAEYFLEHLVERNREKEFIESMVMDLKDDTTKISHVFDINKAQVMGLDSLLSIVYTYHNDKDSMQKAYRLYALYALGYQNVVFTDRTMTQLKNSGGMRLIRNQKVSDSIMNYDAGVKDCDGQFEVVKRAWENQSNYSYSVFDLQSLFNVLRVQGTTYPSQLLVSNTTDIKGYTSRLIVFSGTIRGYVLSIQNQKTIAKRLINYLEQEYDLKK